MGPTKLTQLMITQWILYNRILLDAGLLWDVAEADGEEGGVDLQDEEVPPEGETSRNQQEDFRTN